MFNKSLPTLFDINHIIDNFLLQLDSSNNRFRGTIQNRTIIKDNVYKKKKNDIEKNPILCSEPPIFDY